MGADVNYKNNSGNPNIQYHDIVDEVDGEPRAQGSVAERSKALV